MFPFVYWIISGARQIDLLLKILKESFEEEHREYFLHAYLDQVDVMTETMIPVLQHLVNSTPQLDAGSCSVCALHSASPKETYVPAKQHACFVSGDLGRFVGVFERSSLGLSSNLNFAKLLNAFIGKFSKVVIVILNMQSRQILFSHSLQKNSSLSDVAVHSCPRQQSSTSGGK